MTLKSSGIIGLPQSQSQSTSKLNTAAPSTPAQATDTNPLPIANPFQSLQPIQENARPFMWARRLGKKFKVFIGIEYQLWRWVTQEEFGVDHSLLMGQNTVATRREAAEYMRSYCEPSKYRDRLIAFLTNTAR